MQIQTPRFNEMLRRLMSMKVPSPSPELSADIVPVVVAEPYGVEHRFLAGDRVCDGGGAFGALAGNLTQIQLNIPINNVGVILESMLISSDTNSVIAIRHSAGQGTTDFGTNRGPADARWPFFAATGGCSAAVTGQQSVGGVGLGKQVGSFWVLARTPLLLQHHVFLSSTVVSGAAVLVVNETANAGLRVMFRWRERFLSQDEQVL